MSGSKYKCDRCKEKDAARITVKFRIEDTVYNEKTIDLCHDCSYYGFGLLLKRLPEENIDKWLNQFLSGIIS